MIKKTIYVSLIVQIITFIIGLIPFMIKLKPEYLILKKILSLELLVQFIELVFYTWFASTTYDLTNQDIAKYRYYDWFFTTPVMLITTAMFFIFMRKKNKYREKKKKIVFMNFFNKKKKSLYKLIKYNAIMLLFGYLNEINITKYFLNKQNQGITNNIFIILGFAAFSAVFHELYKHVKSIEINKTLFWIMFVLWFMYGIAALFKNVTKNTMYNILDIFSKNFYGLFISGYVIFINNYN
jgi:hypothetical protein